MPIKQEIASNLTGEWQIGLFEAPCKAPMSFCYGFCCCCCMAAQQRLQILDTVNEPYVCCGGLCPCGPLGQEQDRNCVYLEACCCTGWAISGNRFLIQTRFDRQNTACDDCLLWATCLAQWLVCILQCAGVDVPDEIENCVDCLSQTVNGCMLAQQQVEIDYVQKNGYGGPPGHIMGMLPPGQQQMMAMGKPSPGVGMGAAVGGMVGGAAGAAAGYGMMGGGHGGHMPAPQMMGTSRVGGFMNTLAPNGMAWSQYCNGQQVMLDSQGFVVGAWGECLAYSKVLEAQSPDWVNNPDFQPDGPAGQVMNAMTAACPGHMRGQVQQAAERLEQACDQAANMGQPFPVINYRL